ncbi:MAG: GTP-binding protein [Eubacteriales bacterium]
MRNITDEIIKNIGILAHVDAGKTTLTEQILFFSGAIRKAGSVDSGTTQTDWLPIERSRGISVRSARASFYRGNELINLIDTPGHVDFAGEVERCLLALDGVILVISAVEGIQSHTENLWNALEKLRLPVILFINKIDRAGSNYDELLSSFPDNLICETSRLFFPLNRPVNEGGNECSIKAETFLSDKMTDAAAEYDDNLMKAYLLNGNLSDNQIKESFRECVFKKEIIPVLCGSAKLGIGINELLNAVTEYMPQAAKKSADHLSAYVYKIEHDDVMGKVAHVRMFGGELNVRDLVAPYKEPTEYEISDHSKNIAGLNTGDKITQIRQFSGQKFNDISSIRSGDIAALCGLRSFRAGDVIGKTELAANFKLANPFLSVKVMPKTPDQLTPLMTAISELTEEDPLLSYKWEKTEREILINITGEIQLEVISVLIKERYGLTADFSPPSVIYKETPAKAGYGFEAYTMPKPCWAVVKLYFEPLPRGSGVVYDGGHIQSNKLFYKYQTHIRRSFMDSLEQGLYGWEVTDFKATLADGEHHTIHTHPLDFFVATPMAVMNGLSNTGTLLLEPFLGVRINADEVLTGKIISDIIMMRGQFDAPVIRKNTVTIEASLPVASSLSYPIKLASMSGGKAIFYSRFDGYREVPMELGQTTPRRGINPLDRAKWILQARGALQ